MTDNRLKILLDIFLAGVEDEEDIRSELISDGDDPDEIIKRANDYIDQKMALIKLREGKQKQNKASDLLKNLGGSINTSLNKNINTGNISFAYRKQDQDIADNANELLKQAEKIKLLKKMMDDKNGSAGKS